MISSGFIALLFLAVVHWISIKKYLNNYLSSARFLSIASGISLAYVFVELLPEIELGGAVLKKTVGDVLPRLETHTYIIALLGILFYYGVSTKKMLAKYNWLHITGYLFFNFLIGASLADDSDPTIQPIFLYTIAIGLHYFIRDHLSDISNSPNILRALIASLFVGYGFSSYYDIPDAIVAIGISFSAGGILLNVFHYELPKKNKNNYPWFLMGALFYTVLILSLG